ncbi:hypothetical protein [Nocardia sp. NPDC004860]|uniref:hypothetical protein n=1 Tax=Nocardia sp. NPDC004860 TaxID=3154557 RepID=UPI0033B23E7D
MRWTELLAAIVAAAVTSIVVIAGSVLTVARFVFNFTPTELRVYLRNDTKDHSDARGPLKGGG